MHWKEISDERIKRVYVIAIYGVAVATQFVKSCEYCSKAFLSFFTIVIFPTYISYLSFRDNTSDKLEVQATRMHWVNNVEDLFHYAVKYTNSLERYTSSKWKIECYAM